MTKKIKLKISARLVKKRTRRNGAGPNKHCRFCGKKEYALNLDYKNATFLKGFLTERGKILPSRISGNCALHQRELSREIRKARVMSLLPYTTQYL
ncbi:MAG TPA: 30S ribosomal protein S18 [Candidatus Dependentiae bacterium]|nr:30S ribosomal protein S18 [Candidatus Dependentiae bacterium]HRQ62860.1 30S ribosomal protein S18 [Candidatus Dependentiae bacterium]